jgi:pimeloyl-ACP methyl ester carboxylesterase
MVPDFSARDGTQLVYRLDGAGDPVVCLPGGPMQDSVYLGDLGGLSGRRQLVVLDLRGTGSSAIPADVSSYRCDRLVNDVEALREHLGLPRIDLIGHSAGANLAVLYAASHPSNVRRLALITPSTQAVGIPITAQTRRETAQLRKDEPWFPQAFAALEAITADQGAADDWEAIAPFFYGRWNRAARRHHAAESEQTNEDAARIFGSAGAFDSEGTRAALAAYGGPVLLFAGELDLGFPARLAGEFAGLFPAATAVVQPGAGHFPWLDDPDAFVESTGGFLG